MKIRIMTLNAWGLPAGLARETPERMRAIGDRLGALGADLIALEEIWTASSRALLLKAAQTAGFPHVWHRSRSFGGSGLLLLSRWPIREARFTPFMAAGLPQRIHHGDFWGGKGFVCATVETPAGSLLWVATHLHAGYVEPGEADEYVGVRTAQIIEIASELRDARQPLVLVGDLNFREDEAEHGLLGGLTGLRDAALLTGNRAPTLPAGGAYREPSEAAQRIDYVMLRSGADEALEVSHLETVLTGAPPAPSEARGYSDHVGLMAEIEMGSLPVNPGADLPDMSMLTEIARKQIALGQGHARTRRRREALTVGAWIALAVALSWGASAVSTAGLHAVLLGASQLTFLAAGVWGGLCGWGAFRERLGNRHAQAQLMALKTSSNARDTFRAP